MTADTDTWLLPAAERPWTRGNRVTPLVHGATYFERLVTVVTATGPGDLVWFTDWRGDADELLTADGPTVGGLLGDAARRGVDVRGLLWRSHSDRTSFSAQENQLLGRLVNDAGGCALLDQRVRRGGSHHQKLVVVRHRDRPQDDVAFVGGIDLSHSRRDDAQHAGDRQCQPMDIRYGATPPWHDAMAEIRGPAVHDVQESFAQRWTDHTPLDHRNPYRRALQKRADMPRRAPPLPPLAPAPEPVGPHVVQILRSYAAKRPAFPFAPHGERSIAHAYERAFTHARRLVYIEDQYLWSDLVARTIAAALRRAPDLQVIAVVPKHPDQDGRWSGPPNRIGQLSALRLLHDAGGDRFGVFDLHNDRGVPVYVHAKVCIVDDTWMTCGSDNFNRRSWTHDSELTCAVMDEDDALPREARASLWAEHLGLPAADERLAHPADPLRLWRERAGQPGARIAVHEVEPVGRLATLWATAMYRTVYDPDGRPLSLRLRGGL
jgi:phosphatidylserine/phosphatidylglycerophosphate/cardiolipin synthase-like enzyme